jgi:hypothetical protein
MNVVLWVLQALLGFAFTGLGFNHAFRAEKLAGAPRMAWITAVPRPLMTFIGIAETAGGLGLVLPMLTGVAPWLTPLAAALLAVVMLLAAVFHLQRKEFANIRGNLMFMLLAAVVAWGRWALFQG